MSGDLGGAVGGPPRPLVEGPGPLVRGQDPEGGGPEAGRRELRGGGDEEGPPHPAVPVVGPEVDGGELPGAVVGVGVAARVGACEADHLPALLGDEAHRTGRVEVGELLAPPARPLVDRQRVEQCLGDHPAVGGPPRLDVHGCDRALVARSRVPHRDRRGGHRTGRALSSGPNPVPNVSSTNRSARTALGPTDGPTGVRSGSNCTRTNPPIGPGP